MDIDSKLDDQSMSFVLTYVESTLYYFYLCYFPPLLNALLANRKFLQNSHEQFPAFVSMFVVTWGWSAFASCGYDLTPEVALIRYITVQPNEHCCATLFRVLPVVSQSCSQHNASSLKNYSLQHGNQSVGLLCVSWLSLHLRLCHTV